MCCGRQTLVEVQNVIFCDSELEVENIEIFSFDATDITLAENASTHGPVDVLQC
jgi:hypothetical protein